MSSKFRFHEYDRADHPWQCGGEAEGLPCALGPSQAGLCQSTCVPFKQGDRYFCGGAESAKGGDKFKFLVSGNCDAGPMPDGACSQNPPQCAPKLGKVSGNEGWVCTRGEGCKDGPRPDGTCGREYVCSPRRSLLSKRRLIVISTFGVAVGLLLIINGSPLRTQVLSPGPLSSHHKSLTKCIHCHQAGDGQLLDWMYLSSTASVDSNQSQMCLDCHEEIGDEKTAMLAHGLSAKEIESYKKDKTSASITPLLRLARWEHQQIAKKEINCATCHDEHRGFDFDISKMTNHQCQICHQSAFHSFANGHPEFDNYPHQRRSSIYFDHATHYQMHFANFPRTSERGVSPVASAEEEFASSTSCKACHVKDENGEKMLVKRFEDSCGSCHGDQIEEPVEVFHLPSVVLSSADTNAKSDFAKSSWWHRSETAFTRLLLSSADVSAARQRLMDLDYSAEHHRLEDDAQLYTQSLANLISDLADGKTDQLANRLKPMKAAEHSPRELALHLATDLVVRHQLRLFLDGAQETQDPKALPPERSPWFVRFQNNNSNAGGTLKYRPRHADKFLKSWIEYAVAKANENKHKENKESLAAQSLLFDELAAPSKSGRCMKCHTIETGPDEELVVRWKTPESGFTRFEHAPHLPPKIDNKCTDCHVLDEHDKGGELKLFQTAYYHNSGRMNTDSSSTCTSGLQPLTKADCASCHNRKNGTNHCLSCHNYHIAHRRN